jgi:FkbM family methyltransferase
LKELISWLLLTSEGVNFYDKFLLFFIKIVYLSIKIILVLVLGKKRANRLILKKNLQYANLVIRSYNHLKKGQRNGELLKFKHPIQNFEFYCRNLEDFKIMTSHEKDVLEYFTPKANDIVIDIGAYIGSYTIMASKSIGEKGKVVAIEADPNNYDMLIRNINLNTLTNAMTLNYAVYSKETMIKLYIPTTVNGSYSEYAKYNTVMSQRAHGEQKFVEVNADTLDNLLLQNDINYEAVNWIKIDVEGAEFEVLKGSVNVLSKSKDISILIEIHNIEEGKNFYKEILDFLGNYNFKIDFEKTYESGEKHVLLQRTAN